MKAAAGKCDVDGWQRSSAHVCCCHCYSRPPPQLPTASSALHACPARFRRLRSGELPCHRLVSCSISLVSRLLTTVKDGSLLPAARPLVVRHMAGRLCVRYADRHTRSAYYGQQSATQRSLQHRPRTDHALHMPPLPLHSPPSLRAVHICNADIASLVLRDHYHIQPPSPQREDGALKKVGSNPQQWRTASASAHIAD